MDACTWAFLSICVINREKKMNRAVSGLAFAVAMASSGFANAYDYQLRQNINITSADGTHISAHAYVPVGAPGEKFPVIMFVNSWGLGESEYDKQAMKFAEQGYVALAYAARGWYTSGGLIDVAGPKDMQDVNAVVDYLVAMPEVDDDNIGMTGVSYGGGMTLLAAAHEPRIKTVVSFSGWTNLMDSLYGGMPGDANGQGQSTPRTTWASLLIFAGNLIGHMSSDVEENWDRLMNNYEIDQVTDWAAQRSAATYIDEYNQRQIPVYMINNLQDQLFQSNQIEKFYSGLNYDAKRFDVYRGIHITGEIGGFLNVAGTLADFLGQGEIRSAIVSIVNALGINFGHMDNNVPWKNAHLWFDHYLKGVAVDPATGRQIAAEEKVNLKDKVASATFKDWAAPQDSAGVTEQTFYFDRSQDAWYLPVTNKLKTQTVGSSNYSIYTGQDTTATTGINLPGNLDSFVDIITSFLLDDITLSSTLGGLMEAHLPNTYRTADLGNFTKYYLNINCPIGCYREAGVRYDTTTFSAAKNIVGTAHMNLWVESQSAELHLTTYVYEVLPNGPSRLITDGPVTRRNVVTNQPINLDFDMVFTNYTTQPGSKIAVVFDTEDPLYRKSGTYNKQVKFLHGSGYNSRIEIPFAN